MSSVGSSAGESSAGGSSAVKSIVDEANGVVLRRIVVGVLQTNCWALHAPGHREALLLDPGDEPRAVLAAVADLDVVAVLLTHAHFDHVLGLPGVRAGLGDPPVHAHPGEEQVWRHELAFLARHGHFDAGLAMRELLDAGRPPRPDPAEPLWDGRIDAYLAHGDELRAGPLRARVLHTPGHTPGGVTLSVPGHLLTGDTLFPGGPGLTGWPLSDHATILESVRGLLTGFPPGTVVHPGHGADTTIGAERPP